MESTRTNDDVSFFTRYIIIVQLALMIYGELENSENVDVRASVPHKPIADPDSQPFFNHPKREPCMRNYVTTIAIGLPWSKREKLPNTTANHVCFPFSVLPDV